MLITHKINPFKPFTLRKVCCSNLDVCFLRRDPLYPGASKGEKVFAVAQLVRSVWGSGAEDPGLIPQSLGLSDPDRKLLERGVHSYLLPGQGPLHGVDLQDVPPGTSCVMERYVTPKILKVISAQRPAHSKNTR